MSHRIDRPSLRAASLSRYASAIVEASDDAFIVISADLKQVRYVSPGYETIFGQSPEELYGNPRAWLEAVHPDDRDSVERELMQVRAQGAGSPPHPGYRIVRPDGELRWVSSELRTVSAMPGEPPLLIGTVRDITGEKSDADSLRRSLEEKQVLLKEIHHRVKNNLQVISSLLYLQSRAVEDPALLMRLQEVRSRVRTLSLIHETLYISDDLSQIDFASYLNKLIGELSMAHREALRTVELNADAEPGSLDIDSVLPCGLIVTELVTNALKYAFPGGRRGRIDVIFRTDGAQRELRVCDDGVGLPPDLDASHPDPNASQLGLRLVEALVGQLDGELRVERSAGTGFCVRFVQAGG
ncbi:MAG: PAS domain-containing protein [Myxococcales bacterium]|nr:PAS domain-containing protein [Myxococcales bacterium]